MKHTLHVFLTTFFLLTGINSFAEKKSNDTYACPTANISYVGTPFCSTDTSIHAVTLTGTDAYLGGVFISTSGLALNPTTGAITPNTSNPGVYTVVYTIPANGSCSTVNVTTNVTILPSNTVSTASSFPVLCINTYMSPITHSTTGATGMGIPTGLPTGVTASWSGNILTISGTSIIAGVFNYNIPLIGGCGSGNATGTIIVQSAPTNTTISGGTTTCSGIPVNLTITGTPGTVINWTGTPSSLTIGASGSSVVSVSPTATTTYSLLSASLNGCSIPLSQSTTVVVSATPQFITQIPDIIICNGSGLDIASQLTSTIPGTTFIWSATTTNVNLPAINGDQTNIDQIVNLINPLVNGSITIQVRPQIGSCYGNPQQIEVTVKSIPEISSTTANQTTICDSEFVTITTISNSATAYNWQVNTVNGVQIVGGTTNGTSTTGIVNLQLALTNSLVSGTISFNFTPINGFCYGTEIINAVTITVNPIPGTPIALPINEICSGDATNLIISSDVNITGTMLEWTVTDSQNVTGFSNGTGIAPSTINDVLVNTSNIQGYVKYSVTTKLGDCEGGTTDYIVYVNPLPDTSVLTDGEITVDENGNLIPYVLDTGLDTFNYTFEWYLNNTIIPSATSNMYTATEEGNYSVNVFNMVTNCSGVTNALVTENLVNDNGSVDLIMFPNPSFDNINFSYNNKVMSVQISNQMGQIVLTKEINSKNGTIDLSDLNLGIYNIVFETESGIINQRIIKQ